MGSDIDGVAAGDLHGKSISLSGDGLMLAVGATGVESNKGSVSVYEFNSATWLKYSDDILGTESGDLHGNSVSLSADGKTLAIGAWGHDNNKGTTMVYGNPIKKSVGVKKVYSQIGQDLDGLEINDNQGWSVSLSSNGMTLAVGAYGHDNNKGTVRIYNIVDDESGTNDRGNLIEVTDNWLQIGNDINGDNSSSERTSSANGLDGESGDKQGYTVSLSSDGVKLAVGALSHNNNTGTVRAYSLIELSIPITTPDSITVDEDSQLTSVNVVANDTGNGVLTLKSVSSSGTGTVAVNADGLSVDYTPAANFNGTENVTYSVSDGSLSSEGTLIVTVTPVNDTPLATNQSVTTIEDIPLEITLSGTDIESDPLTYAIVTSPSNGSVTLVDNKATYVPSEGFFGSDSFTFKVNDGTVDSPVAATVSITVTSNDTDGDGVLNDMDECPNTPAGSVVNFKGCIVFSLPANNNKVQATSASCIGTDDGSIALSVEDSSNDYTISVTGQSSVSISGDNKTGTVTGLAKGTYQVLFQGSWSVYLRTML